MRVEYQHTSASLHLCAGLCFTWIKIRRQLSDFTSHGTCCAKHEVAPREEP